MSGRQYDAPNQEVVRQSTPEPAPEPEPTPEPEPQPAPEPAETPPKPHHGHSAAKHKETAG